MERPKEGSVDNLSTAEKNLIDALRQMSLRRGMDNDSFADSITQSLASIGPQDQIQLELSPETPQTLSEAGRILSSASLKKRRERRDNPRKVHEVICPVDGVVFFAVRNNATFCSKRCTKRASRGAKKLAS